MSKPKSLSPEVTEFSATLPVLEPGILLGHRSGSAALRTGSSSMQEKARKEGFAAGRLEGFQAGHSDGLQQGLREFEEAHQAAIEDFRKRLEDFVETLNPAIEEWYARAENALATLAVDIARQAVCRELETSRESVLDITRQALMEVRHGTEVRVRVNPLDASILESRQREILAAVSGIRQIVVVPDLRVVSGCEIETDGGVIDGTVATYLDRVEREAA